MKKVIPIAIISSILIILALSLISAYHPYDDGFGSYTSYKSSDYYKKTTTLKETETSNVQRPYGYQKTTKTTTQTTTVERKDYPVRKVYVTTYRPVYAPSRTVYYYDNDYYPGTNFRYKQEYNYRDYGKDAYGRSYYYEPVYDWNLGYYNWRY